MAQKYSDIVRVTTSTTGTGDVTLGSAVPSYLDFTGGGISNGDTVTYGLVEGSQREIGHGRYNSGTGVLSRDTIIHSTNSGAKISLAGGAQVYLTVSSADIITLSAQPVTVGSGAASVGSASSSAVSLTTTIDDPGAWASGNPTRITIPAGQTRARITAYASASASCGVAIYKNGSLFIADSGWVNTGAVAHLFAQVLTTWIAVTPGDYFEVYVSNPSNTAISVSGVLQVEFGSVGVLSLGGTSTGSTLVPPDPADFSWVNQSGASATLISDGSPPNMQVVQPNNVPSNIALFVQAAPATPYKITGKGYALWPGTTPSWMGCSICVYNSGSSKIMTALSMSDGLVKYYASKWNSPTSQNTNFINGAYWNDKIVWHQIENDGVNIAFKYSTDGRSWVTYFSEALSSFIGSVTHVGVAIANNSGGQANGTWEHFNVGSDEGF